MKTVGLRAKLVRVFALQVMIISLATVLGIYVTQGVIVEDLLTRAALEAEAEHFWNRYSEDSRQPLPDTANMRGYLSGPGGGGAVPPELLDEPVGFGRIDLGDRQPILHVSERDGRRLYLVFEQKQVSDLALYFGFIPLTIVLLLIYSMLFVAYRMAQRAISPIVRLANYLERFDFEKDQSLDLDLDHLRDSRDTEVQTMIDAVDHFTSRLDRFIERERVFTRDAGHELRTPVAVLKGSLDLMERNTERPKSDLDALRRMRRTVEDMESLLETLMLLAREGQLSVPDVDTVVNEVVAAEVEQLTPLAHRHGNTVSLSETARLTVPVPARIVQMLIGNLLRNAINYTRNGRVDVSIAGGEVVVSDTGVGMAAEELEHAFDAFYRADSGREVGRGHGLGLAIVKRLALQFGWTITAESELGKGTTIRVRFVPDARTS